MKASGFTLLEMLVALVIIGILAGILFVNLRDFEQPARDDANGVAFLLKAARSQAMSITGATRVRATTTTTLVTENSSTGSCLTTPTHSWTASGGSYTLSARTSFVSMPTDWSVCFSDRGIPDSAASLTLRDTKNRQFVVSTYLGGSVEVTP